MILYKKAQQGLKLGNMTEYQLDSTGLDAYYGSEKAQEYLKQLERLRDLTMDVEGPPVLTPEEYRKKESALNKKYPEVVKKMQAYNTEADRRRDEANKKYNDQQLRKKKNPNQY